MNFFRASLRWWLILVGGVASITFTTQLAYTEVTEPPPIKIGWIGPLSGNFAFLGVDSVAVARRVLENVNRAGGIRGRKIEFVAEDDQYETGRTVSAYRKLVHVDRVKVIFTITYGGLFAIAPLAEKDGILLIDPLDCDEEIAALPQNTLCVAKRSEDIGVIAARDAVKRGLGPGGILYFAGDPFPIKVAQAARDTMIRGGMAVPVYEGISGMATDFRSHLVKVKERGIKSLFIYGGDDFGLAMKQAREMGIDAQFYASAMVNSPGYRANAGAAVEGTILTGWFAPRTSAYAEFIKEFTLKSGRLPILEIGTVPTYDLTHIIVEGMRESVDKDGALSVERLRDYLYRIRGYPGLSGSIAVDSDGAVRSLVVGLYRYEGGEFKSMGEISDRTTNTLQ